MAALVPGKYRGSVTHHHVYIRYYQCLVRSAGYTDVHCCSMKIGHLPGILHICFVIHHSTIQSLGNYREKRNL